MFFLHAIALLHLGLKYPRYRKTGIKTASQRLRRLSEAPRPGRYCRCCHRLNTPRQKDFWPTGRNQTVLTHSPCAGLRCNNHSGWLCFQHPRNICRFPADPPGRTARMLTDTGPGVTGDPEDFLGSPPAQHQTGQCSGCSATGSSHHQYRVLPASGWKP